VRGKRRRMTYRKSGRYSIGGNDNDKIMALESLARDALAQNNEDLYNYYKDYIKTIKDTIAARKNKTSVSPPGSPKSVIDDEYSAGGGKRIRRRQQGLKQNKLQTIKKYYKNK
jgi:hypothetical protein